MATKAQFVMTSLDNRRWRRLHFKVPVRLTLDRSGLITVINSSGYQMNPGGIGVIADAELAIGDQVAIEFPDYHLTLRGVIRNRTDNRYGVEFLATSKAENEQLGRLRQILSKVPGN